MTLPRLAGRLLLLPGRLLIRSIDNARRSNRVSPLNGLQRGSVHGFLAISALIAFSMATHTPPPATASAPPTATAPRYTPAPRPTPPEGWVTAAPSTAPSPAVDEPADVDYIPLPDDGDGDWDKPRICHRKWWC